MKGAPPLGFGSPTGVLACLGALPEIGEVRIQVPLQGDVALADQGLEPRIASIGAEPLELCMWIEDQRGPPEAPRQA